MKYKMKYNKNYGRKKENLSLSSAYVGRRY